METKTVMTKTEKIKSFVKSNSDIIIGASVSLVAEALLVYSGYKIGYIKGTRAGRNGILDEIVDVSCSDGLIMRYPDLGRYIFTAKKLDD